MILRLLALFCVVSSGLAASSESLFQGSSDIGGPARAGSVLFDPTNRAYQVTGGGNNIWFTNDAFHYTWTRASGDVRLTARVEWPSATGHLHRKACLMLRQSLAPDSPYVDVAVHGNGLVSLQFRQVQGEGTREVQFTNSGPVFSIERRGDSFFARCGNQLTNIPLTGAFIRAQLTDPIFVGLAVCSHDDQVLEKAVFKDVKIERLETASAARTKVISSLETVAIGSRDRRVVYHAAEHIEAPNWFPDNQFLLFNSKGRIYRLPAAGGTPTLVDTGEAIRCNNDHGLSPDGRWLAISDQHAGKSQMYVLPSTGGSPRLITPIGPSYWHGWSPDAKTLVYCAERNGEYDVYSVPVTGGPETRLTTAAGLDDGPEYSADGKWIYFNSDRTGRMQIWRMRPDGSEETQVTRDELNNWFPHPSPDSRWLVFLSYGPEVKGHPANQPVSLRIMPHEGGPAQVLVNLFGGQGTINVPSWSPDSKQLAFVSYELVEP